MTTMELRATNPRHGIIGAEENPLLYPESITGDKSLEVSRKDSGVYTQNHYEWHSSACIHWLFVVEVLP